MPGDSRLALRLLIKDRGFALISLLVLAIGIGAVTTQFSVINGLLLRGLDFPDADRLMGVALVDPSQPNPNGGFNGGGSTQDFLHFREHQRSFDEFVGYLNGSTINVTWRGNPVRYTGGYPNWNFFRALGVKPVLGRDFTPADDQPGAEKTVILSHQVWQRDFGGDPSVVGQAVRVNGRAAVVIGIMPPGFNFPVNEQLWVPFFNEFPPSERGSPRDIGPAILARLKPGVTAEAAAAELTTFARSLAAEFPATNRALTAVQVQPFIENFFGPQIRQVLQVMLGAVVVVLLIACVNVMNMQFARAARRTKELAIRGALGASRGRLLRQMLIESLVLATFGAALGIGFAGWATSLLHDHVSSLPFPLPYWVTFDLDWRVLCVSVAATGFAALASGLIPAWLASRARVVEVLKEGGRGGTSRFVNVLTRGLVIGQIALTAALLIVSTYMVRSTLNQQRIDFGYDTSSVIAARLGLFDAAYPDDAARMRFYERALRELRADTSFTNVSISTRFRLLFSGFGPYEVDGETYAAPEDRPRGSSENITDGHFAALGVRILEGRDFAADDTEARQPVAIVNASLARKHFRNESPIGRRVRTINPDGTPGPWRTIVGVAPDLRMQGPFNNQADGSGFYAPLEQQPPRFATIVVRGRGPATGLVEPLRRSMARIDPDLPLYFVNTPSALFDELLGQQKILAGMFSAFGAVAMLLAAVGLYGVTSYAVSQRTQEYGIRMALGADRSRIVGLVLRQGGIQLAVGLLIGLALTTALVLLGESLIQNFLFGVRRFEPAIWGGTIALLSTVTFIACVVPARRASRVDPMVALRFD